MRLQRGEGVLQLVQAKKLLLQDVYRVRILRQNSASNANICSVVAHKGAA
jgi:hypothetical protein